MSFLLPSYFSRIGWIVFILTLLYVLGMLFTNFSAIEPNELYVFRLPAMLFMVSLVFMISARRKIEDEMISSLRLIAFQKGLYLAVLIAIVSFLMNVMGADLLILRPFSGINFILVYVLVSFEIAVRKVSHEE